MKVNLSWDDLQELSMTCGTAARHWEYISGGGRASRYGADRALDLREWSWFFRDLANLHVSGCHNRQKGGE